MGKQDAKFTDEEKAWLEQQYAREDVQTLLKAGGGSILKNAAGLIFPDYAIRWADPLPQEPEELYKRRLTNASPKRKPAIKRRAAESPSAVQDRMEARQKVHIREWLKKRRTREPKAMAVPALTPQRRVRGMGALDVYMTSPLGKSMVQSPPSTMGAKRHVFAEAFHSLDAATQADFRAQATAINDQRKAAELEAAGDETEVARAMKAPAVAPYMQACLDRIEQDTSWAGVGFLAGLDDQQKVKCVAIGKSKDKDGNDFWTALANAIGWTPVALAAWALHWLR
ncbi:hypothetical protein FKP32DRAFT_1527506, partial [Trametes sanguinea]